MKRLVLLSLIASACGGYVPNDPQEPKVLAGKKAKLINNDFLTLHVEVDDGSVLDIDQQGAATPNTTLASATQINAGLSGCALYADSMVRCGTATVAADVVQLTPQGALCWIKRDGSAFCDGQDQLPLGGMKASRIASAGNLVCVILADQTVRCWTRPTSGAGTPVAGISGATEISLLPDEISSGEETDVGCVLVAGGEVRCFSNDGAGLLGDGQDLSMTHAAFTGIAVLDDKKKPLSGAVAVEVGRGHAAAILSDGTVVQWGGGGTAVVNTAAKAPKLDHMKALSLGGAYLDCGLRGDGVVLCWGDFHHVGIEFGIPVPLPN